MDKKEMLIFGLFIPLVITEIPRDIEEFRHITIPQSVSVIHRVIPDRVVPWSDEENGPSSQTYNFGSQGSCANWTSSVGMCYVQSPF